MRRASLHVGSAALMLGALLVACGGAEMRPDATKTTPTKTLDDGSGGGDGTFDDKKKDKTTVAEPALDGDFGHAQKYFEDSAGAFTAAGNDCLSLCKALASMQRAANHLCELSKDAGDDGKKRCDDAQSRVTEARGRVKSSCGGCGS